MKGQPDETLHGFDETLERAPTKLKRSEMHCDCMKSTYCMDGSQRGAPSPTRPLSPLVGRPHSVEPPPLITAVEHEATTANV